MKNAEELIELYLKSDVVLLTCVFEKLTKISIQEIGLNLLYFVSLPSYTWQFGLKFTDNKIQSLQDKDLILLFGKNIRGGISSIMGNRYVKSDEKKFCM